MDELLVYGADWCGDCVRAKRFLETHSIPFQWIDIDKDRTADETVRTYNQGKRIIPTIIFKDGSRLIEPTNSELAHKFNINERS
jgi:glutaredoxin-like protein